MAIFQRKLGRMLLSRYDINILTFENIFQIINIDNSTISNCSIIWSFAGIHKFEKNSWKWVENLKQSAKKFIKRFNLLFFVTDMYQMWYLDAAKMFFGSVLQFLFQMWILRAAMYYGDAKLSQYLSVMSDILNIRKVLM